MSELAVTTINERAAEEFYRKGLEAETHALHEKAVEFYERALHENSDHEGACFHLAMLYDRRAEDAKAIELYERLCTASPVHLSALMNLAVLYEDNNHYEEARRCLGIVLKTNPNHERARLYLRDVESARSMYYDEDDRFSERRFQMLDIPITDFELSVRSRNCLRKISVNVLGDLLRVTEGELLAYKNFGDTSLNEVKLLLASKGLRLGQALEDPKLAALVKRPEAVLPPDVSPEVLNKPVSDLDLSVRARKALQRLNINTVGDLAARTEPELLGCKNFGQTSLTEVKDQLKRLGLALREVVLPPDEEETEAEPKDKAKEKETK